MKKETPVLNKVHEIPGKGVVHSHLHLQVSSATSSAHHHPS